MVLSCCFGGAAVKGVASAAPPVVVSPLPNAGNRNPASLVAQPESEAIKASTPVQLPTASADALLQGMQQYYRDCGRSLTDTPPLNLPASGLLGALISGPLGCFRASVSVLLMDQSGEEFVVYLHQEHDVVPLFEPGQCFASCRPGTTDVLLSPPLPSLVEMAKRNDVVCMDTVTGSAKLPSDWSALHACHGLSHFAAVPLFSNHSAVLAGAIILCCGPADSLNGASDMQAQHDKLSQLLDLPQLRVLGQCFSLTLFSGCASAASALTGPQLACEALRSIHHALSLTDMLNGMCYHACLAASQLHHVDFSARVALAPATSGSSGMALMIGAATGVCAQKSGDTAVIGNMALIASAPSGSFDGRLQPGSPRVGAPSITHSGSQHKQRLTMRMGSQSLPRSQPQPSGASITSMVEELAVVNGPRSPQAACRQGSINGLNTPQQAQSHSDAQAFRLRDTLMQQCLSAVQTSGQAEGLIVPDCKLRIRQAGVIPKDIFLVNDRTVLATSPSSASLDGAIAGTGAGAVGTTAPNELHSNSMGASNAYLPGSLLVLACPTWLQQPDGTAAPGAKVCLYLFCSQVYPQKLLAAVLTSLLQMLRALTPALSTCLGEHLLPDVRSLLTAARETAASGAAQPIKLTVSLPGAQACMSNDPMLPTNLASSVPVSNTGLFGQPHLSAALSFPTSFEQSSVLSAAASTVQLGTSPLGIGIDTKRLPRTQSRLSVTASNNAAARGGGIGGAGSTAGGEYKEEVSAEYLSSPYRPRNTNTAAGVVSAAEAMGSFVRGSSSMADPHATMTAATLNGTMSTLNLSNPGSTLNFSNSARDSRPRDKDKDSAATTLGTSGFQGALRNSSLLPIMSRNNSVNDLTDYLLSATSGVGGRSGARESGGNVNVMMATRESVVVTIAHAETATALQTQVEALCAAFTSEIQDTHKRLAIRAITATASGAGAGALALTAAGWSALGGAGGSGGGGGGGGAGGGAIGLGGGLAAARMSSSSTKGPLSTQLLAAADLSALDLYDIIGRGFTGVVLRASQYGLECAVKVFDYPDEVVEEEEDSSSCASSVTGEVAALCAPWSKGRAGADHGACTRTLSGTLVRISDSGEDVPAASMPGGLMAQARNAGGGIAGALRDAAAAKRATYARRSATALPSDTATTKKKAKDEEKMKQLQLQKLAVREKVERAAMELAVCTSVPHPNIVQVYAHYTRVRLQKNEQVPGAFVLVPAGDVDTTKEVASEVCLALVMEFCDMGGLDTLLFKGGLAQPGKNPLIYRPNLLAVYLTLIELALALKHLHAHNIAHCDVKPGNMMLKSSARDPRGFTAKLADFGFAKLLTPGKGPGGRPGCVPEDASGTLPFMAPELFIKGAAIDASVDIYAFGITMHMLMTGQGPYPGVDEQQVPRQVVCNNMRPVLPVTTPSAYRVLATRCWSRDPLKRPTAAELALALSQQLAQLHMQVGGKA